MFMSGTRTFAHCSPTTYKRITPDRGCGFILKRIYELTEAPGRERFAWPTKKDVYLGTPWYNRPGFASLLWSALIKDGLIESDGGIQNYKCWSWGCKNHVAYRAAGLRGYGVKYTVRYHLTPKGRGVLFDMMARVNKKKTLELNAVGSVAEHDAKKDWAPKPEDWREDDFLEPGEIEKEWLDRHTHSFEPKIGKNSLAEKLNELEIMLDTCDYHMEKAKEILREIRSEIS